MELFRGAPEGWQGPFSCWTPERSYTETIADSYNRGEVLPAFERDVPSLIWRTTIDEHAETVADEHDRPPVSHGAMLERSGVYVDAGKHWVLFHEGGPHGDRVTALYLGSGDVPAMCVTDTGTSASD